MQNNGKKKKPNILFKSKRMAIVSIVAILVLLATIGSTVALLVDKTGTVKNILDPIQIECEVDDTIYSVKNEGDYAAYIRAAATVNYVQDSGAVVYGQPPKADVDYTVSFNNTDWVLGSDGFYYHKAPVDPNSFTTELVTDFDILTDNAPDGFEMKVQIIAEAIQCDPVTTVCDYWNVTIDANKLIVSKA